MCVCHLVQVLAGVPMSVATNSCLHVLGEAAIGTALAVATAAKRAHEASLT